MVHPCATNNPGTVLHACDNESSTVTLCGLPLEPGGINLTAGYTSVCPSCYPAARGDGTKPGDPIQGRGGDASQAGEGNLT